MEIVSNKINQIATSRISESIINTYTYSQDVGDPIVNIRIETSKNGNKVAGTDYMGASNRLLLDMNDYKALDLGERKAIVSAILDDVETILSGKMKIVYNNILPIKGFTAINLFGVILLGMSTNPLIGEYRTTKPSIRLR